jgi:UDPglucose 6-dehydrogenase
MISSLTSSNYSTQTYITNQVASLASKLSQKHIGIWGLTFKAGTDDLRDSPALAIVDNLASLGFELHVFDPTVRLSYEGKPESVHVCESAEAVLKESKLLVVLTEWPEFGNFLPDDSCAGVTVFDSRLVLNKTSWLRAGATPVSFGTVNQ